MSSRAALGTLLAAFALAVGCDGELCDAEDVQAALDDAAEGEVVEAGACEIDGALRVPAGVTLRGQGAEATAIVGNGGAVVTVGSGAGLEALSVRAELGRAVVVEGPGAARLAGLVVAGPVDEGGADVLPPMPGPDETATHGLIVDGAGSTDAPVVLDDVTVRGFGRFGALFLDSHVAWEGGGASENLATGLMAVGGRVELTDVAITDTYRGLSPFAYGAVFRDGAQVVSDGLVLRDNQGPGALHDHATIEHAALEARGNDDPGLWVQSSARLGVDGATLEDNAVAGLVVVDTEDVTVTGTTLSDTRMAIRVVDDVELQAGDGIHLVMPTASSLRLEGVTASGNPRAGLLVEVGDGALPDGAVSDVVVDASGDAFGAVAQTPSAPLAPDVFGAGLERRGAAAANDAALADRLGIFGAVAPMFLPPPTM
ncbi:MAG TPA: hypothetical protein RMH99_20960 [Sandaracinaceae bacterium LLY-WYZ-13_1]|nr:hypothetical protein [Sandaracinaceae bacterium LLY-WYZ-13_1]